METRCFFQAGSRPRDMARVAMSYLGKVLFVVERFLLRGAYVIPYFHRKLPAFAGREIPPHAPIVHRLKNAVIGLEHPCPAELVDANGFVGIFVAPPALPAIFVDAALR